MFSRFLSALLLLAALPLHAKELRVCAEPDNLPYSHADENGFENRIARLLADELQATLLYAWALQRRAFVRKSAGTCEVFIGVPTGFERLSTTKPYYRSSYVFVSRARLSSFAELKDLRVGVQLVGDDMAATPAGHGLAAHGIVKNVVGFTVYGERPAAQRMVEAIAANQLDAAVVWGPAVGWFAAAKNLPVTPAPKPDSVPVPFQFAIAVGVRRGHKELRDQLERALVARKDDIGRILDEYRVPRLP